VDRVLVVGAGISGAACARAVRAAGLDVTVVERGRAVGGRMASPHLHGRRVDIGAAYFTVTGDGFAALVADWRARGLAHEWTDTLGVFAPDGLTSTSGTCRFGAPGGLRSLARDLHTEVSLGHELREFPDGFDVTVLAMPDPQAARLVGDAIDWVEYDPVIAVVAGFAQRTWQLDAAFVNEHPAVTLVADDGSRRADGAPVLVIHTTPQLARAHLDDPDGAVPPAVDATRELLRIDAAPQWTYAHRWRFAKPAATHGDAPYWFDGPLGVCGDSWCPNGAPRVEAAWLSGHRLGLEIAARLGSRM
jgi:hypothetical protein